MLLPQITQSGMHSFDKWRDIYQEYIDSIFTNIQCYLLYQICYGDKELADSTYDWNGMHSRLERYLYTCSANRFRSCKPIL